jgi:hypothetical protein
VGRSAALPLVDSDAMTDVPTSLRWNRRTPGTGKFFSAAPPGRGTIPAGMVHPVPGDPAMAPLSAILRHVRRLASDGQPDCPDAALLARFTRARDESAFEELLRRHGAMVWGVCSRRLRDRHAAGVLRLLQRGAKAPVPARPHAGGGLRGEGKAAAREAVSKSYEGVKKSVCARSRKCS